MIYVFLTKGYLVILNIADLPDDIIGDLPDISGGATTGENTDIALTIQGEKPPATAIPPPIPPNNVVSSEPSGVFGSSSEM